PGRQDGEGHDPQVIRDVPFPAGSKHSGGPETPGAPPGVLSSGGTPLGRSRGGACVQTSVHSPRSWVLASPHQAVVPPYLAHGGHLVVHVLGYGPRSRFRLHSAAQRPAPVAHHPVGAANQRWLPLGGDRGRRGTL